MRHVPKKKVAGLKFPVGLPIRTTNKEYLCLLQLLQWMWSDKPVQVPHKELP